LAHRIVGYAAGLFPRRFLFSSFRIEPERHVRFAHSIRPVLLREVAILDDATPF
jgi:hypothetical protein